MSGAPRGRPRGPCVLTGPLGSPTVPWARELRAAGMRLGTAELDAREDDGDWAVDGDFVAWHQDLLWRDCGDDLLPRRMPRPSAADLERLRSLVVRATGTTPWGVHDPRAAFFAGAWLDVHPDAHVIGVVGSPFLVFERLAALQRAGAGAGRARRAVAHSWTLGVGALLAARRRAPGRVTIAMFDDDADAADMLAERVRAVTGLPVVRPEVEGSGARGEARHAGMARRRCPELAAATVAYEALRRTWGKVS